MIASLFRQNPLAFVLATVASLLAVAIALEVGLGLWPATQPATTKAPPASDIKMLPPLASVMPDTAYPESAARPLFTPTRRPAPAAPTSANTMAKGLFTLQGVISVGDQRIALLREKSSGKVIRLERGKELNGMTLSVVDPDKVTLAQGGDEEILTMQVQKGPAVAAGAPGGPAPQPAAGPFGGPTAPVAAQPGGPAPAVPALTPPPPAAAPGQPVAQPNNASANPAQRSGFGPFLTAPPNATPTTNSSEATPMTPEELLARRRARRGQQTPPNQ